MKRVLIVSTLEAVSWGGSEELWHYVAKSLLNKGVHVGISRLEWNPIPQKLQELLKMGATYMSRPNIHIPRSRMDIAFRIKNQSYKVTHLKKLEEFRADSILINQGGNFDAYLEKIGPFLLTTSAPYFIVCHHSPEHFYLPDHRRILFRQIFTKAAVVVFVSKRNREVTERVLATHLPNAQVVYHPPITIKKNIAIPFPGYETINLACVARLDVPYKGQDILLEALATEKWSNRTWELRFYGKGNHKSYLDELIKLYKLTKKVKFVGQVEDITNIWAENHMLVLPSLSEGTPLALFEASYYNRPAVVTDVGGNREIVVNGETGFVADAANSYSLNLSLENAWQNKNNWEEMGRKAKTRIEMILGVSNFNTIIKALTE